MVNGEQVAREVEVSVGSIWAVHQKKAWYRVEVIGVSFGNVSSRSMTMDMSCLMWMLVNLTAWLLSGATWLMSSLCRKRPGAS